MKLNGSAQIAHPPTAVWQHITHPQKLSASLNWVADWQAMDDETFLVNGRWHFIGERQPVTVPAQVTWQPKPDTQTINVEAQINLSEETLPVSVEVRLQDVGGTSAGETAVHFSIAINSTNRFIKQMVKRTLPKLIDQSFSQIQTYLTHKKY